MRVRLLGAQVDAICVWMLEHATKTESFNFHRARQVNRESVGATGESVALDASSRLYI